MKMDQKEDVHTVQAEWSWFTENHIYSLSTQSLAGAAKEQGCHTTSLVPTCSKNQILCLKTLLQLHPN